MRQFLQWSRVLMGAGGMALLSAVALATLAQPSAAFAQDPPPRPTLTPTAIVPTATPNSPAPATGTSTPAPTKSPSKDNDTSTPLPTGRITGTVIDETTGAPAPGVRVLVGDVAATTDTNGNYYRDNLPAGDYQVSLMLDANQGVARQEPLTVRVVAGTVIQHLRFASPAPVVSPPASVAPGAPTTLPATGTAHTAELWFVCGGLLLMCGLAVRVGALRRRG